MNLLRALLLVVLIASLQFAYAVPGVLSGTITRCTGGPANGATVTLLGTAIPAATTNAAGFYSFSIEQGSYHVRVVDTNCGAITQNSVIVSAATTQNIAFPVDVTNAASIPDAAGYSAVENGDVNGVVYNWFEISPSNGGPGTATNQLDRTSVPVALPFTFRFYGVNYTQVYISSEGALTFDGANNDDRGDPLPYPSMGHAIMAMWDNFDTELGGDICYYYHSAEHAFIVEWFEIGRDVTGDQELFQV
ncbi:MAG: carboxypeptidase regulatory-like domain-containing protein [bacterium]|nr:carboxypeptidase regulatory-like domain-containing protein [bacterium]